MPKERKLRTFRVSISLAREEWTSYISLLNKFATATAQQFAPRPLWFLQKTTRYNEDISELTSGSPTLRITIRSTSPLRRPPSNNQLSRILTYDQTSV